MRAATVIQCRQAAATLHTARPPSTEHTRGAPLNKLEPSGATAIDQTGVVEDRHHREQRIERSHLLVDPKPPGSLQHGQRNPKRSRQAGRCLRRRPDAGIAVTNAVAM